MTARLLALAFVLAASCGAEPIEEIGEFVPVFEDEDRAVPPVTVTYRAGDYIRTGNRVTATMEMEWQNEAQALTDFPVRVRLPFAPRLMLGDEVESGDVELMQLDDTPPLFVWIGSEDQSQAPEPDVLVPVIDQVTGAVMVRGDDVASDGAQSILAYGSGAARIIVSVTYETTGDYQYDQ
jgi:hypothetical protein